MPLPSAAVVMAVLSRRPGPGRLGRGEQQHGHGVRAEVHARRGRCAEQPDPQRHVPRPGAVASAVVVVVMVTRGFDVALDEIRTHAGAGVAFLAGWRRSAYVVAIVLALVRGLNRHARHGARLWGGRQRKTRLRSHATESPPWRVAEKFQAEPTPLRRRKSPSEGGDRGGAEHGAHDVGGHPRDFEMVADMGEVGDVIGVTGPVEPSLSGTLMAKVRARTIP